MKRGVFIAIPLLIALGMTIVVAGAVSSFPTAAKIELDKYIRNVEPSAQAGQVVRASRPWEFTGSTLPTFGDGWNFETDHEFVTQTETVDVMSWQSPLTSSFKIDFSGRGIQLAYPAKQVWCVALHSPQTDRVLLLALHHQEPYETNWVIHQGPAAPYPIDFKNMLEQVGCDL